MDTNPPTQVVDVCVDNSSTVRNAMAELSDCTIVCGGTAFRVHKGIIARCSSVFARMWTKGFKEADETVMRLSDDEAPVLGAVLAYIYNGRYFYPLPGTTLVDYEACMRFDAKVYVMADKYDVDFEDFDDKRDLKKLCANQFATNLGKVLENAALNVCGTDLIDIFKLVLDNTRETDRPLRAALVMGFQEHLGELGLADYDVLLKLFSEVPELGCETLLRYSRVAPCVSAVRSCPACEQTVAFAIPFDWSHAYCPSCGVRRKNVAWNKLAMEP